MRCSLADAAFCMQSSVEVRLFPLPPQHPRGSLQAYALMGILCSLGTSIRTITQQPARLRLPTGAVNITEMSSAAG